MRRTANCHRWPGETTGAPVELVVAVSEAGGMGVLGGSGYTVDELREAIREIKKLTDKPYGVALLLPKNIVEVPKGADGSPQEIPISQALEFMPQEHKNWLKKVKAELGLPDVFWAAMGSSMCWAAGT